MAQITAIIPDDKVADLVEALEIIHERLDNETDLELIKRCMLHHMHKHYVKFKALKARQLAALDAADDIIIS